MWEKVISKVLSGRFILTVFAGLAFLFTILEKTIPSEAAVSIMTMVFVSYFNRKREV